MPASEEQAFRRFQPGPEPSRARYPDESGHVPSADGTRIHYEVYGSGHPTILFPPTWSLVHSRVWKGQIPYLARHFRVLTIDGRGNGRSDRPQEPEAYGPDRFAADIVAVMEATATDSAVTVGFSIGTVWSLILAATEPDRVLGACFIGPVFPVCPPVPGWMSAPFNEERSDDGKWARYNRHSWRRDWRGFAEFWARLALPEPHSTREIEDVVAWALDTDPETILAGHDAIGAASAETVGETFASGPAEALAGLAAQVRCPVRVVCGDRDAITPLPWAEALAAATGGELDVFEGYGHSPHGRYPVRFNLGLRRFVEQCG
jgi:pimeloyl-ACP methyl ester carboxylesterase